MENVSQEELDKGLKVYENVSTEEVEKINKKFKFILFLYNKNILFTLLWFAVMLPAFFLYIFAGINYATNLFASFMFVIYPIIFFCIKKTIFKYSEIEDEYFRRKVQIFEHVLKDRKEKGAC
jgi:hypothetical protein